MRESHVISSTLTPETRETLKNDFENLGLHEGMTIIVHSSLSSIGWISGGAVAFIQALMDVITPSGNIVMPAHSGNYSDPVYWENPPVPKEWCEIIKESMPAYEEDITPTFGIGIIAETFRRWPGVIRSSHPQVSFSAWGKDAVKIIENHQLDFGLGENSPLARIYDLDGYVLLIGVGYDRNTSFHLSEYRAPMARVCENGAPILDGKERVWRTLMDIEFNTDCFNNIGRELENRGNVTIGQVGSARAKLFKQRVAADFAEKWIEVKRKKEKDKGELAPM